MSFENGKENNLVPAYEETFILTRTYANNILCEPQKTKDCLEII